MGAGARLKILHGLVPRRVKRQGESVRTFDGELPFSMLWVREDIPEMYQSALSITHKMHLLLIKKSETRNINVA